MAKGILAILGKPSKAGPDDDETEPDDMGEGGDESPSKAGERASQDAIDAINEGNAKALYEAMERVVAACHAGGEE